MQHYCVQIKAGSSFKNPQIGLGQNNDAFSLYFNVIAYTVLVLFSFY